MAIKLAQSNSKVAKIFETQTIIVNQPCAIVRPDSRGYLLPVQGIPG